MRALLLALALAGAASAAPVDYNPPQSGGSATFTTLNVTGSASVPNVVITDSSTNAANTAFVQQALNLSMATIPLAITGGTISFASTGTACTITYNVAGGAISSALVIVLPGSGYQVGDVFTPTAGNRDAYIRVATVGTNGGVTGIQVLYGGTGYVSIVTAGAQLPSTAFPFTFTLSGVLTSNVQFIMTQGTYLAQSNQWVFNNNTTGAFTVAVNISGTGLSLNSPIGNGVIIPRGVNSSAAAFIQTDGVNDVWYAGTATPFMTVGYGITAGSGTFTSGVTAATATVTASSFTVGGNQFVVAGTSVDFVGHNQGEFAASGNFGQIISTSPTGDVGFPATGVSVAVATTTLTPGCWLVTASAWASLGASTVLTGEEVCTSKNDTNCDSLFYAESVPTAFTTGGNNVIIPDPPRFICTATTIPMYLVVNYVYTTVNGSVVTASRTLLQAFRIY